MGVNGTKLYSGRFLSCRVIITEFTCTQECDLKLRGFTRAIAMLIIAKVSEPFDVIACHIYINYFNFNFNLFHPFYNNVYRIHPSFLILNFYNSI